MMFEEAGYEIIPALRLGKGFADAGGKFNQVTTEVYKGWLTPEQAAKMLEEFAAAVKQR